MQYARDKGPNGCGLTIFGYRRLGSSSHDVVNLDRSLRLVGFRRIPLLWRQTTRRESRPHGTSQHLDVILVVVVAVAVRRFGRALARARARHAPERLRQARRL